MRGFILEYGVSQGVISQRSPPLSFHHLLNGITYLAFHKSFRLKKINFQTLYVRSVLRESRKSEHDYKK